MRRPRSLALARDHPFDRVRPAPSGASTPLNRMCFACPDSPRRPARAVFPLHRRIPAAPPCVQSFRCPRSRCRPIRAVSPPRGGRLACLGFLPRRRPYAKRRQTPPFPLELTLIKCRLRCRSARTARLRLSPRGHLRSILSRQLTKNCVARSSWSTCRRSFMPCMRDWSSSELMKGPKRNTLSVNGL